MNDCYALARAGEPRALEAIATHLRPRLAKMAVYYSRCVQQEADDLLQEAWLGVLDALPSLDLSIGSPEQYLIQRARWRLLDAIKRARLRQHLPLDEGQIDPASGWDKVLALVSVAEFSGRLKTNQRAVLDCLLRGLTWRETGEVLGCTSANVAYHVRQIQQQYTRWGSAE